MAFTFCTNCGNKIEDGVEKCPYCGHIKGSERTYGYAPAEPSRPQAPRENEGGQGNYPNNGQPGNSGNNVNGQNGEGGYQAPSQNPYGGQYGNPYGNQYGGQPSGDPYGNPYGQNQRPYGQQYPYGMPPPGGYYRPVQDRPMSVGLLIFSIINIIFGCCCSVGFVFGIIALVYTINARQSPTDEEEIRRKKIALIMNIAAVVMTVAFIASFTVAYVSGLLI